MTPSDFLRVAVEPCFTLLPPLMDSPEAKALLVAIALQESGLTFRRQVHGPAVSYFQFELTGIEGVLTHPKSSRHAMTLCLSVDVAPTAPSVYRAIEFHDVLACGLARLLLWTLPMPLPSSDHSTDAWDQYLAGWLPGRPRPETWERHFDDAWEAVA